MSKDKRAKNQDSAKKNDALWDGVREDEFSVTESQQMQFFKAALAKTGLQSSPSFYLGKPVAGHQPAPPSETVAERAQDRGAKSENAEKAKPALKKSSQKKIRQSTSKSVNKGADMIADGADSPSSSGSGARAKTKIATIEEGHQGHRQRLRERFLNAGAGALAEYELLELLLFSAIPRRDVKPLAKKLIRDFGSYASVLSADKERLRVVSGLGDVAIACLKIVAASVQHLTRTEIMDRPLLSNMGALLDYLRARLAREKRENFLVLFLDTKRCLIAEEQQSVGTIDQAPVYTREVVKRALELDAVGIILVHNHPSGDPKPSKADIDITREIVRACHRMRITVHDHVIIARSGYVSLKNENIIP